VRVLNDLQTSIGINGWKAGNSLSTTDCAIPSQIVTIQFVQTNLLSANEYEVHTTALQQTVSTYEFQDNSSAKPISNVRTKQCFIAHSAIFVRCAWVQGSVGLPECRHVLMPPSRCTTFLKPTCNGKPASDVNAQ